MTARGLSPSNGVCEVRISKRKNPVAKIDGIVQTYSEALNNRAHRGEDATHSIRRRWGQAYPDAGCVPMTEFKRDLGPYPSPNCRATTRQSEGFLIDRARQSL